MTPLVDVAFLLLTFFMFTTSMRRPQTMEINLPPDKDVKVEVAESNLLTLRVNKKGEIFWKIGHRIAEEDRRERLRTFLKEQCAANPKVVTLLKIDREGEVRSMVDMIDELTTSPISSGSAWRRCSDQDKELLAKVQA